MPDIRADLKADNSDFRRKISQAEKGAERFSEKMSKLGLGFVSFAALASTMSAIVDAARNLENPVTEAEKAAKRFAGGLDEAKAAAVGVGVTLLGSLNSLGEMVGRQIAILKNGRAQVELAERIEAETEATLKNIAAQVEITREQNRLKAIGEVLDEKMADYEASKLPLTAQILRLEAEYLNLRREAVNLGEKSVDGLAKINAAKGVQLELTKLQDKLDKGNAETEAKTVEEAEKQAKALSEAADAAEKTTEELRKQLELEGKLTPIVEKKAEAYRRIKFDTTGTAFEDQSTRSLEKVLDTITRDVARRESRLWARSGRQIGFDPFLGVQRDQQAIIERELNARREVERNISAFGEERAFGFFDGSEYDFDRIVRSLSEQPANKETVRLLDNVDRRLSSILPRS